MTLTQDARRWSRRTGLIAAQAFYSATGATQRGYDSPGVILLLLHESPQVSLRHLMRHVERHRDRYVDFAAVDDLVDHGTQPEKSRIAITFDDGLASNFQAARMLAAAGLRACFYIPTDGIGMSPSEADAFFRRRPVAQRRYKTSEGVLGWREIEEIAQMGHAIGSHCRQHKPLISMSSAEAEDQVKGSIEVLNERLGGGVRHFAWPFGGLGHAPVDSVVRWCADVGAVAASGVRGHNTGDSFSKSGYLYRDAVEYPWLATDLAAFTGRRSTAKR